MTVDPNMNDRFKGCLIGLAIGDAIGTTVEFKARDTFEPVTDMVGGGPFDLEAGQWTDDTSMALCLAESLLISNGFDADDLMQRFCMWWDEGYLSSTGECFDIGITVSEALSRFTISGNPFSGSSDPLSAGNGSIMRLAPVPMYYYKDLKKTIEIAVLSSKTTHGTEECLEAGDFFSCILNSSLIGKAKEEILKTGYTRSYKKEKIKDIAQESYLKKSIADIRGTGYVVESLEAALWCFEKSDSFESAILSAVNLGDDADTTAAVCGQLAGAYYGYKGMPSHWKEQLCMHDKILGICDELFNAS